MKIVDRIKEFITHKRLSMSAFNEKIGAGKGYIEKQIQRKGSIGGDVLEKIVHVFPEINPVWLLTGEGEMLRPVDDTKSAAQSSTHLDIVEKGNPKGNLIGNLTEEKCAHLQELIQEKERVIKALQGEIEALKQSLKDKELLLQEKNEKIARLESEFAELSQHSQSSHKSHRKVG